MNLITRIRKSYVTKGLAMTLALNMLFEIVWPTTSMALTSGPSQPEVQSFEPVETTDMVNLFTGDFAYNIPLMYLPGPNGGYPINLAYHGNVTMDQEASWVGLGWNINAGAINRAVRGVPDDFDGDVVKVTQDIKDNFTAGLGVNGCLEIFGADNCEGDVIPSLGLNFYYNNFKGFGYTMDAGASFGESPSFNVGLSLGSDEGIGVNASITLRDELAQGDKAHYSLGVGFNSKRGLDFNSSISFTDTKFSATMFTDRGITTIETDKETFMSRPSSYTFDYKEKTSFGKEITKTATVYQRSPEYTHSNTVGGAGISFSESSHAPSTSMPMNNYRLSVSVATGIGFLGVFGETRFSGFYDTQVLQDKGIPIAHEVSGYENMTDEMDQGDFSRSNDGNLTKTTPNLAIPQITHDYYMIQGQGIGGSFRPYRNEVGRIFDPTVMSFTEGGYFNANAGAKKIGWGFGVTTGYSSQKAWDSNNNGNVMKYTSTDDLWENPGVDTYKEKEEVYYKSHGEKTSMHLDEMIYVNGEDPVRGTITGTGFTGIYGLDLPTGLANERNVADRIARNNLIHKLTNAEITNFHENTSNLTNSYATLDDDYMHEYEIFFYNWSGMDQTERPGAYLNRRMRGTHSINHHNAGYKVLDESGSYYVYGLPVYNTKQVETVFTVDATAYADASEPDSAMFQAYESIVPMHLVSGEIDYKIANTHKYYSKRETPPYASSYLLSSILGTDYVDTDNNGPSDADKGYWVKFDYVKYADDYKWRAPYDGCMYNPGSRSTLEDDKGSYQYGEKEVYYLSRMETATHIVIFDLSTRLDQYEAKSELNEKSNSPTAIQGSRSGLKIDRIHLYEKKGYLADPVNAVAIQTVHFDYDYSLCPNVKNNSGGVVTVNGANINENKGKLTLKKIWFTYEGNERGALNPYVFDYSANNPDYSTENYDRWGNYKPLFDDNDEATDNYEDVELSRQLNQELPYTDQYYQGYLNTSDFASSTTIIEDNDAKDDFQDAKNMNTSAWCLEKITLPTGGEIDIQYESDDYAYVQSERATQMTYITDVNDNSEANRLYFPGITNNDFEDPTERRIYFKLEQPIPEALSDMQQAQRVYDDYVKDIVRDEGGKRNLYFRNYTQLKGSLWDYVSGYLPLEESLSSTYESTTYYHYGVSSAMQTIDGVLSHTHGFVTIECYKDNSGNCVNYHPMAMAAWQHIRTECPQILNDAGDFDESEMVSTNSISDKKKAKKVKSLLGWIPELHQMIIGYRLFCFANWLGLCIDFNKSMIRLTTPDRKKFGGGNRVKQIALSDNWDDFESSETAESYGLKYDYTTYDIVNGTKVYYSSGVAQYEPMIGADEIALRYPKFYPGKIPFKTKNNLFFEHPVNETYMPAPVVGYSKVTVTSLNTAQQIQMAEDADPNLAPGRGVSGVSQYEFYTAKDFPVMVEETDLNMKKYNVPIIIPFVCTFNRNKIAGSQGYKIELNDMHGKLRSVAQYGLDKDYFVLSDPLTKTTYKYNSIPVIYHGKVVNKLNNKVNTLTVDQGTRSYVEENRYVGMEYEFFTDQRHNKSWTMTIGYNSNIDNITIGAAEIPLPTFWVTVNSSKNDVRTYVTNKIIHKSGLLTEVENINEHYITKSQTLLYDRETGRPVLTVQKNEFDDEIYNLSHSAHWEYDGMGQAYKNINLEFVADLHVISASAALFSGTVPTAIIDDLMPGDEFIVHLKDFGTVGVNRNFKGTFISKNYGNQITEGNAVIHIENFSKNRPGEGQWDGTLSDAYFKVYRSGRRNHFMAEAGSVTSLSDPVGDIVTTLNANHTSEIGTNLTFHDRKLSNVLSANAATFRDNWETENNATYDHENPYKTGEAGIWRSHKQYVYVDDRTQNKTTGIKPYEDGVMNNVALFNWQVQDFEQFESKWFYSGEVTRYNEFGYETENRDRLGIYSAALYGYNKAFVIGLGGNANYYEIGVEDFERFTLTSEVSAGHHVDDTEGKMDKESNLNFYEKRLASTSNVVTTDNYRIVGGEILTTGTYVVVDRPFTTNDFTNYWEPNDKIDFAIISTYAGGKQEYKLLRATVSGAAGYDSDTKTKLFFEVFPHSLTTTDVKYLPVTTKVGGRITVYKSKTYTDALVDNNIDFVNTYAHSGKQCMRVGATTFIHGRLRVEANKPYQFSCWIRRDNSHVPTYTNWDIEIEGEVSSGSGTWTDAIEGNITVGRIINGWQKVDIEFTPTYDDQMIRTSFNGLVSGGDYLYVDDVRIAPKTGGMVSYVYDPENFRLKAILNPNNYATYYFYDEQGRLHVTKQETAEGVFTISETRGYTRPTVTP